MNNIPDILESTIRMQEGVLVKLALWTNGHTWTLWTDDNDMIYIRNDQPMRQAELVRWLEKTQPIE